MVNVLVSPHTSDPNDESSFHPLWKGLLENHKAMRVIKKKKEITFKSLHTIVVWPSIMIRDWDFPHLL